MNLHPSTSPGSLLTRHRFNPLTSPYGIIGGLLLLLGGCVQHARQPSAEHARDKPEIYALTASGTEAADPCFSVDHHGNPVLSWTEKLPASGRYILKYAVFDTAAAAFRPACTVTPSAGTKTSAESANKVAFKSDGTVVALFGKRFDDPHNPFAGAIQYTLSADQGISWSAPRYLHTDTVHQHGRGFFDMATLADGEVGAVWLDGRFAEADTGSALFFACTSPGQGFGADVQIGESTCECCRTDILVDAEGSIHLAYRDILYPPERMGRQVRDMVYTSSADNGKSFLPPVRISADNWEVEGCPHSGPSLGLVDGLVRALWFTGAPGAPGPGVYQTTLGGDGIGFAPRKLLSAQARHPQLTGLPGGGSAMAWDESISQGSHASHSRAGSSHAAHGDEAGASHAAPPAVRSGIVVQLTSPDGVTETLHLNTGTGSASHPVLIAPAPDRLLAAWVETENGLSGIRYCYIRR